jgi:acyl-coenzyme A thioesterase PaaI-like protein
VSLAHHELCFGCGQANLFGLQMELAPVDGDPDAVSGRFFLKQDHQGPPGMAHGGIITSALDEAMAMVLVVKEIHALTRRLEVDLLAPAPVGTFLAVEARLEERAGGELILSAAARGDSGVVAEARGLFVELGTP